MTKSPDGDRCRWCGRPVDRTPGPGRRREFCRPSHRQRDYEARRRAAELGLSEDELVVTRAALHRLQDQLYVLECAIEDVERDVADDESEEGVRRALDWLLQNARPLVGVETLIGER